jgi:hypothetical protein
MSMLTRLMAAERQRELVEAARGSSRRPGRVAGRVARRARRARRAEAGRGGEAALAPRSLERRASR